MTLFGPPTAERETGSNLIPLAPIAVTAADFTLNLAGAGAGFAPPAVLLDNESPYLLQLSLGGGKFYLRPWVSNVFPTGGAAQLLVHPIALSTPLPDSFFSSLLVTLIPQGEQAPGIYPMEATRQASQYGASRVIGNIQAAAGTSTGPTTMQVPRGTQSIGLLSYLVSGNEAPNGITIVGHSSGMQYVNLFGGDINASLSNNGPQWTPFSSDSDNAVDVTITALSAFPCKVDILASPLVMAMDTYQADGNEITVENAVFPSWAATSTGFSTVAAGGTLAVVTGQSTSHMAVQGWHGMADTSAAGARLLAESATSQQLLVDLSGATTRAMVDHAFVKPLALPLGESLRMRNPGTAAAMVCMTFFTRFV